MNTGVEIIAGERKRQLLKLDITVLQDRRENRDGELAIAAACYLNDYYGRVPDVSEGRSYHINEGLAQWPWAEAYYHRLGKKPTTAQMIKELAKAGALIAAEIDRISGIEKDELYKKT